MLARAHKDDSIPEREPSSHVCKHIELHGQRLHTRPGFLAFVSDEDTLGALSVANKTPNLSITC